MKVTDYEVAKKLLSIAASARDRGIEFDMSFAEMKKLMKQEKCYYTGIKFTESGPLAKSIDRVDNDRGYVDGNVVGCGIEINSKKKDLTIEEIRILYFRTFNFLDKNKKRLIKKNPQ